MGYIGRMRIITLNEKRGIDPMTSSFPKKI